LRHPQRFDLVWRELLQRHFHPLFLTCLRTEKRNTFSPVASRTNQYGFETGFFYFLFVHSLVKRASQNTPKLTLPLIEVAIRYGP
jgi:hypothetical protein